jgi:Uncharacterized protein conserved in bacteria (DUF2252)
MGALMSANRFSPSKGRTSFSRRSIQRLACGPLHSARLMSKNSRATASEVIAAYRKSLPEQTRILFDRFTLFDLAFKVAGVGTQCDIGLFMAGDNDPLLRLKEARMSVLEPYAGKSLLRNHGQRVVVGQRIMQSVGYFGRRITVADVIDEFCADAGLGSVPI